MNDPVLSEYQMILLAEKTAGDFDSFLDGLVPSETYAHIYRNQLSEEYREKFSRVFKTEGFEYTPRGLFSTEKALKRAYEKKHKLPMWELDDSKDPTLQLSMKDMGEDLYGERWVELYRLTLGTSIEGYIYGRFLALSKVRVMEKLWWEVEEKLIHRTKEGDILYHLMETSQDGKERFDIYRATHGYGEKGLCMWNMPNASRPTMTKYLRRVLAVIEKGEIVTGLDPNKKSDIFLATLVPFVQSKIWDKEEENK